MDYPLGEVLRLLISENPKVLIPILMDYPLGVIGIYDDGIKKQVS